MKKVKNGIEEKMLEPESIFTKPVIAIYQEESNVQI